MASASRIVLWSIVAILFGASQGHATHPVAGKWVNVDENTGSITRVEVREEAGGLVIQAWGDCGPNECDWGAVPLHMAVDLADDGPDKPLDVEKLKYGVALWDHKERNMKHDIRTFMTLHVEDGGLIVESVDVFGKASGRSKERPHLRSQDSFKKSE